MRGLDGLGATLSVGALVSRSQRVDGLVRSDDFSGKRGLAAGGRCGPAARREVGRDSHSDLAS